MGKFMITDFSKFRAKLSKPRQRKETPEEFSVLEAYWEDLRQGEIAPFRSELDPHKILNCLDHCFILDWRRSDRARFRLSGQAVNRILGIDLRGMPASSIISPALRMQFDTLLGRVPSKPAKLRFSLSFANAAVYQPVDQWMILPLRDPAGQLTRAVGMVAFDPLGADTQQRYSTIADTKLLEITSNISETEPKQTPAEHSSNFDYFAPDETPHAFEFAEEKTDFLEASPLNQVVHLSHPTHKSERSYLRLVHSN